MSTLTSNIVSYWKLDEASGNAADSVGSNTLTNNSVTYGTGKINNGADFEGSSANQSLSITDASQSGLDITSDISFSFWWKPESVGAAEQYMVSKFPAAAGNYSYRLGYDGSGNINLTISNDGTSVENLYVSLGTINAGTWYHLVTTWKASTKTATHYKNGSSLGTAVGAMGSIHNGNTAFMLGNYSGSSANQGVDGFLDEVGIWNKVLTSDEVTELYNGGSGFSYPFESGSSSFLALF